MRITRILAHDQHRLAVGRHVDIGAHDGEIGKALFEDAGSFADIGDLDQLETDRVMVMREFLCRCRQDRLIVAVTFDGDAENRRPLVEIGGKPQERDKTEACGNPDKDLIAHRSLLRS